MPTERAIGSPRFTAPIDLQPRATVSRCRVNANGVPAEWVEASAATIGQSTIVIFGGEGQDTGSLDTARQNAEDLAVVTGARVFLVGCRPAARRPPDVVQDSLDAYAWLLGEGLDLSTTTLIDATVGGAAAGILLAARTRGLPLPDSVMVVPEVPVRQTCAPYRSIGGCS